MVAAFASVAAYRGDVALGGGFPQLMKNLLATKKPVALVRWAILICCATSRMSRRNDDVQLGAAERDLGGKALFGEIPIGGKLPVTIPGFAKYGDGIALSANPYSH